jgi:hypothetical protein
MKQYHPDIGGDEEICKCVNAEYDAILQDHLHSAFTGWKQENSDKEYARNAREPHYAGFSAILRVILEMNVRVEIIGYWIYCFDSYEVREKLSKLGFWYSQRHKAWVYNGKKKVKIRSRYSTNTLRDYLGSEKLRDKKDEQTA